MCAAKRCADAMLAEQNFASQGGADFCSLSPMIPLDLPHAIFCSVPASPERSPTSSMGSMFVDDDFDEPEALSESVHSKSHVAIRRRVAPRKENSTQNMLRSRSLRRKRMSPTQVARPHRGRHRSPDSSEASTAAPSSASSTPVASPVLCPIQSPSIAIDEPPKDHYCSLNEEELRDQLGLAGTQIAVGWEKEDLISVLQMLDKIEADMPALEL